MLPAFSTSNFAELLQAAPLVQLTGDVLVVGHLVALAVGIATVLRVDVAIFHRLKKPFGQADLVAVYRAHSLIRYALLTLWVTGLGLFIMRTGGDPKLASPKLVAKLLTVSWLSFTALAMSHYGLWVLGRCIGRPLLKAPLLSRVALAMIAGLSVAGWGTALLLGAASTTRTADWAALSELLALTHFGAVAFAVCCAVIAPLLLREKRGSAPKANSPATTLDTGSGLVIPLQRKHAA